MKRGKDKSQRKAKSYWSPANIKFLKENFYKMSYRELSKTLDKSKVNIWKTAKEMGMIKPKDVKFYDLSSDKIGLKNIVCGIYVIKNATLNLYYIGASVNIAYRLRQHVLELDNNKHYNKILQKDWNNPNYTFQYGIWDRCSSEELGILEENYIKHLDSTILYNINNQLKLQFFAIEKLVEIIESRIEISPSGCWLYPSTHGRGNYGNISYKNKCLSAHRIMYTYYYSDPYGSLVRHICNIPNCCNPNHLKLGWHSDNAQDRFKDLKPGDLSNLNKHKAQIIELNKTMSIKDIAKKYSVSYSCVSRFIKNIGEWPNRFRVERIKCPKRPKRPKRVKYIEAWGEFKTLGDWAKDDRCSVCVETIRNRLKSGMCNEDAIGTNTQRYKILPSKHSEIIEMRKSGRLIKEIALEFLVSEGTIRDIVYMYN